MILICDSDITDRACALRNKLFDLGIPCAVSVISDIGKNLPVMAILTFCDVFDSVRRTPFDDIFVVAIGNGFVNSALNAKRAADDEEAFRILDSKISEMLGLSMEAKTPFGVYTSPNVFVGDYFIEIYGNMILATSSELMIFKYLDAFIDKDYYFDADKICRFCLPLERLSTKNPAGLIAVHVRNINEKFEKVFMRKLIRSKRNHGYFICEKF